MNKRIKPYFIALTLTEAVSAFLGPLVFYCSDGFLNKQALDNVCLMAPVCAGVWLPFLMAFIGICIETNTKRLFAAPAAVGLTLVLSAFGLLFIQLYPRCGFLAGFRDLPRMGFYLVCGFFSAVLLIAALVRITEIKKEREKFMSMTSTLFEGKSALLLIIPCVLTVVCGTPAVCGFLDSKLH